MTPGDTVHSLMHPAETDTVDIIQECIKNHEWLVQPNRDF